MEPPAAETAGEGGGIRAGEMVACGGGGAGAGGGVTWTGAGTGDGTGGGVLGRFTGVDGLASGAGTTLLMTLPGKRKKQTQKR